MKTSFFSVLALPALFLSAVAAPSEVPETAVAEKRQVGDAYSIVESLYSEIQQYTGSISMSTSMLELPQGSQFLLRRDGSRP